MTARLLIVLMLAAAANGATVKSSVEPRFRSVRIEFNVENGEFTDDDFPYDNLYAPGRPQREGNSVVYYLTAIAPGPGSAGPITVRHGADVRTIPRITFDMPAHPQQPGDIGVEIANRKAAGAPIIFLDHLIPRKFVAGHTTYLPLSMVRAENLQSVELLAESDPQFSVKSVEPSGSSVGGRFHGADLRMENVAEVAIEPRQAGHFQLPAMRLHVRYWPVGADGLLITPARPPEGVTANELTIEVPRTEIDVDEAQEPAGLRSATLQCTASPVVDGQPVWVEARLNAIGDLPDIAAPATKGGPSSQVVEVDRDDRDDGGVIRKWLFRFDPAGQPRTVPAIVYRYHDLKSHQDTELRCDSPGVLIPRKSVPPPERPGFPWWLASMIASAVVLLAASVHRAFILR